MNMLNLKPTHQIIKTYYAELGKLGAYTRGNALKEGAVAPLFAPILRHCASQCNRTLIEQYTLAKGAKNLYLDGAIVDAFNLMYGIWEAKDDADDLDKEAVKKFADGYPKDNILFQAPQRAMLWQHGQCVLDRQVTEPDALIEILRAFFAYEPPVYQEWHQAVEEFKETVQEIGKGFLSLIDQERRSKNATFIAAFDEFVAICRENINPNISIPAVEEMLVQHLLTERIFRRIFNNFDFVNLNIIAREIEKVILALVTPHGGRSNFFQPLDRFYHAIEATAASLHDFAEKQAFLNTVYEKFFQGFSVKVADTHGIVYTPQPIVAFMVNSIEEILQREFQRSLSDKNVHILDPFVGTGNFLLHVMRRLKKTALPHKYAHELHCNEVMLLPYYIASMNIEHEYYTQTGEYQPFPGICFVDTFQLAEPKQAQFAFMTAENTARVKRQKDAPIFVILGNPPYNAGQVNENDNNKNRKYAVLDKRVADTYAKDSQATNKNALSDMYVKAMRWASDRIANSGEGVVAFVTNNGFIDGIAFDGMRKQLGQDFDLLYILDLGGNVRKNPKLSGTTHNVFGIQVGVSVNLLVKTGKTGEKKIYYARVGEDWRKEQKYEYLTQHGHSGKIVWQEITPDLKHNWLMEGFSPEFDAFLPMGTKEEKSSSTMDTKTIFKNYGRGVVTCRDAWAYHFDQQQLAHNIQRMIEAYNTHVFKWSRLSNKPNIDDFVDNDETNISWSRDLKLDVKRGKFAEFQALKIRSSLYRPFTHKYLFFDRILDEEVYQFPHIFPTPESERENRMICVNGIGSHRPFECVMTNKIVDLGILDKTQCFPFYVYDDPSTGSGRRENITDWALAQFRAQYVKMDTTLKVASISRIVTKWDIFYYVYAVLHHPEYRAKYAANLKRDLPRIPFVVDLTPNPSPNLGEGSNHLSLSPSPNLGEGRGGVFWAFADAGRALADVHVNYEQQPEYDLRVEETPGVPLNWRVEKMKLSKDRSTLIYNEFLSLTNLPPEVFEYTLGNKSALQWLIDQYQVTTDKRSGIVNDPNRADEPEYIVSLIKKIVTVSVETVKIVNALPSLEIVTSPCEGKKKEC